MSEKGYFEIDKLIGKTKNRISRVGVELEGGWEKSPPFKYGEKIERDGSVKIDPIPVESSGPASPVPAVQQLTSSVMNARIQRLREALEVYNNGMRPENRITLVEVRADGTPFFADYRGRLFGLSTSREMLVRLEAYTGANLDTSGIPRPTKYKNLQIGEIASPVLEVTKFEEWMRDCYPQHVNSTCGLHVHMSFRKSMHYERLMVPEYQGTIINYLTKWAVDQKIEKKHPIWERLSGKNEYCKHEFFADVQARKSSKIYDHHGSGNRYTAINYCHGQHGTIECRVLPMFAKVDDAVSAVKQVIDITNACLRIEAKKGEVLDATLIEDSVNGYREVRREII